MWSPRSAGRLGIDDTYSAAVALRQRHWEYEEVQPDARRNLVRAGRIYQSLNAEVLMVMAISISILGATAFLFNVYRIQTIAYYVIFPPMMLVTGYALARAYGADQDLALVMAAAIGLLGVQLAWVLTTRIPRP